MRIQELTEASLPQDVHHLTYYHGTGNEKAVRDILKNGIKPPDYSGQKENNLTPVAGKVYATPSLPYAVIYAIGGNYESSYYDKDELKVPYTAKTKHLWSDHLMTKRGEPARYGYVFVIPAKNLENDVQPDEDEVGELFSWYLRNGPSDYHSEEQHARYEKAKSTTFFREFVSIMSSVTTPLQKKKMKDAEYEYFAKAGKKALKLMPEYLKEWLVSLGMHIAHEGRVFPSQCWKFDKRKIGWLKKDCSNFFELAERIV